MHDKPIVLWFRNDLRLGDHAALVAAVRTGAPILPLYILDDASPRQWKMGGASRWWLGKSLAALSGDLASIAFSSIAGQATGFRIGIERRPENWLRPCNNLLGASMEAAPPVLVGGR